MRSILISVISIVLFTTSLAASPGTSLLSNSDSTARNSLSHLLDFYYNIKDALVNSNAVSADSGAVNFVNAIQKIDINLLTKTEREDFMSFKDQLIADAKNISQNKDLSKQRMNFASLSDDLYSLAKKVKLTTQPIYRDYCPMKKKYWLSSESKIRNPYYGKAMETCGSIKETLK